MHQFKHPLLTIIFIALSLAGCGDSDDKDNSFLLNERKGQLPKDKSLLLNERNKQLLKDSEGSLPKIESSSNINGTWLIVGSSRPEFSQQEKKDDKTLNSAYKGRLEIKSIVTMEKQGNSLSVSNCKLYNDVFVAKTFTMKDGVYLLTEKENDEEGLGEVTKTRLRFNSDMMNASGTIENSTEGNPDQINFTTELAARKISNNINLTPLNLGSITLSKLITPEGDILVDKNSDFTVHCIDFTKTNVTYTDTESDGKVSSSGNIQVSQLKLVASMENTKIFIETIEESDKHSIISNGKTINSEEHHQDLDIEYHKSGNIYSINQSNQFENNQRSKRFEKAFEFNINSINGSFNTINPDQLNKSQVVGKFNSVSF